MHFAVGLVAGGSLVSAGPGPPAVEGPSFRFASKFQYGVSMLFCCIFEELGVVNYGSL